MNLKEWDETATYMVLDDVEFDYLPMKKPLFFGQKTFSATQKWVPINTYKWGKPVLYLCNNEPDWSKYMDPYQENIVPIYLHDKIY